MEATSSWVETNGMSLAPDKCYKLEFRGTNCQYKVGKHQFWGRRRSQRPRHLCKKKDLNWSAHASRRLKKAYNVLFSLKRNIAYVKSNTKLSLYKSLVLPIVTYGLFCAKQSKATMNALERLQTKAVKWIMGNKQTCYAIQTV